MSRARHDYHVRNRKYGRAHRRARAALLAAYTPGDPCSLCGEPMTVHLLDLAHDDDGGYLGLAHQRCNRGFDAARLRAATDPTPRPRTRW